MSVEITIKDFLLHYLNDAYTHRSEIITNLTNHVERLYNEYLITNIERTKYMKLINKIIKIINITYNKRIKLLKDDNNNVTDQYETYSLTSDNDDKINISKIDNLNKNISEIIKLPIIINNSVFVKNNVLDIIIKLSSNLYHNELKAIIPNDFKYCDSKIKEILLEIGTMTIQDIIYIYNYNDNTLNDNLLYNLLKKIYIPLYVYKKNEKKDDKNIKINKCMDIPEKYESLLENFYKVEYKTLEVYGYFENDCVNSNIRTSQICNEYLYEKKKKINQIINNPDHYKYIKIKKAIIEKIKYIPTTFKELYIKNLNIGEILSDNINIFINNLIDNYTIYQKYSTMNNFKLLFGEFINSNLITKYKIIKYLLLSSNLSDAGLLYGLTRETKLGSNIIADIIHKNLNLPLQLKLHKVNISIKTEIEKINNLDTDDIDLKKQIIANKNMPQKAKKLALEKINEMKSGNSEYYKQLLYVKTLIDFPWTGDNDGDIFSLYKNERSKWKYIMESTNKNLHTKVYGHTECKNTIIELLGKWFSNPKSLGKAIGLWGPPGVGKTLIAKELGDALGIPCTKINLGGIEDGAILSGHSITYSGAVPGLIIKRMVEAGKPRCIMFFDELDKTCYHHGRNEIYDILIHVIDSITNNEFNDKFFQDISFPINKVLFIFSFNDKSKIDPILLDRMEIIKVDAYTTEDKINIVKNFLIKDLQTDIGLNDITIEISDENIIYLIDSFTQEPGVRSIRRKIEKILLKLNKDKIFESGPFINNNINNVTITKELIDIYLTKPSLQIKKIGDIPEIGVVNGLFATSQGDGGIIPILIYRNHMGNSSKFCLKLTGKQGKVMKESVEIAWTLASNLVNQKYLDTFFKSAQSGLHIHTPDGATDKDGPSAGSAFLLAFFSIILNKCVKNNIGITGELERSGTITAIGGLEYKLPGAKKAGINLVFIPKENQKDVEKIKEHNKSLFDDIFKYILVDNIKEVLNLTLIESDTYDNKCVYNELFQSSKYLKSKHTYNVNIYNNKKIESSDTNELSNSETTIINESSTNSYSSDKSK